MTPERVKEIEKFVRSTGDLQGLDAELLCDTYVPELITALQEAERERDESRELLKQLGGTDGAWVAQTELRRLMSADVRLKAVQDLIDTFR